MGIRIDPTLEFVWRDPHTVQLGADPTRAVVAVPTTAQERFLSALRRDTAREALLAIADQAGCSATAAAAVLAAAAPALLDEAPRSPGVVEVHGTGPMADGVVGLLAGDDVAVVRTAALRGAPVAVPEPPPRVAVLVADHVVDPGVRSAWIRRDLPQLPVVVGDGRVRIGPLIEPDAGPCLWCLELARTDEDPTWPTTAGQLLGRAALPPTPLGTAAVAVAACRIVLDRLARTGPVDPSGEQLLLTRAGRAVTTRTVSAHPRCACRGLPGNGSAAGPPHASTRGGTRSP